MNKAKIKKAICCMIASAMCSVAFTPLISATAFQVAATSYADIPSEYVSACDWVWDNRIYDDEHEDWMKDYATIYDQLIAGNGTVQYLIRWDSYQTITYEQRQKLEVVLNEALNKWNDCLEGYANWPFDDITVKIVGWSVLDRNCLQDIHADEVIYKLRSLILSAQPHNLIAQNETFKKLVFEENSFPFGKDGRMVPIRFFGTMTRENLSLNGQKVL